MVNRTPPHTATAPGGRGKSGTQELRSGKPAHALGATYSLGEKLGSGGDGCGRCRKGVSSGIQCDICDVWYHGGCVELTKKELDFYESAGEGCSWICRKCRENIREVNRRVQKLEDENTTLRDQNRDIMEKLGSLITKIDSMRDEIVEQVKRDITSGMESQIYNRVKERLDDDAESRKRECNLLIHGMINSRDDENLDINSCKNLFGRELGLKGVMVVETIRLKGRNNENADANSHKGIPLLVKLKTPGQKWAIISKAKFLRESEVESNRKIRIVPDLTLKEREKDKQLRDTLIRRRENGERDLFIRKGQICKRDMEGSQ